METLEETILRLMASPDIDFDILNDVEFQKIEIEPLEFEFEELQIEPLEYEIEDFGIEPMEL